MTLTDGEPTPPEPDEPTSGSPTGQLSPAGRVSFGAPASQAEPTYTDAALYRQVPYRPDSVVDSWQAGSFTVRAASVRGDWHRARQVPRQDEMALGYDQDRGTMMVAVADGVSGAPLSHFGAAAACRYAIEYFLHHPDALHEGSWDDLVQQCAWAVVETAQHLTSRDEPDPAAAAELCATTLCVVYLEAVPTGSRLRAVTIGDSGVGLAEAGGIVPCLGARQTAHQRVISNTVVPLPLVPQELATWERDLAWGDTVVIGTDGLWDPIGDGYGTVSAHIAALLLPQLPNQTEFLRGLDFYKETYVDDRTMVAVRITPPPT